MRVSILTEGVSEFKSLPILYPQLHQAMPARSKIVQTLKVNAQPDAPFPQIVASCRPTLAIARRFSDMAIILLDREQQHLCSGHIASKLEQEFRRISDFPVRVALKNRMYENWLIADLESLKSHPKRFAVDSAAERRIAPNKADSIDGLSELKRMVRNGHYDKVPDSSKICRTAAVDRIAHNSRSFRHFLHLLGYGAYKDGCRMPQTAERAKRPTRRR